MIENSFQSLQYSLHPKLSSLFAMEKSYSQDFLIHETGLSLEALYKEFARFKAYGGVVVKKGNQISLTTNELFIPRFKALLHTQELGKSVQFYSVIDSTNEHLFRLLAQSDNRLEHGFTLFAKMQLQGRGRGGHSWYSESDGGLYFSILLRPKIGIEELSWITLALGIGVAQAIELYTLKPSLKWPNDILVDNKKVSGILIESRNLTPHHLELVAGIGINLNQKTFPNDLGQPATSMCLNLGKTIEPNKFCANLFAKLEETLILLGNGDKKVLLNHIWKRSSTLNKTVTLKYKNKDYRGVVEGFSEKPGIFLRLQDGSLREFPGETSSLREIEP